MTKINELSSTALHPPSSLNDSYLQTQAIKPRSMYCKPCNQEFTREGYTHHILTSSSHILTCCRPCNRNFASEADRLMHWWTADVHKYTFDCFCNTNFDDVEAFVRHQKQNPKRHHICKFCDIDFGPYEDLRIHWETADAHKDTYDRVCRINFDSVESYKRHQRDKPTKHFICLPCNSNHHSLERLRDHWNTTPEHKWTYDAVCKINFTDPAARLCHSLKDPPKHHMCLTCQLAHNSVEELKSHELEHDTYLPGCESSTPGSSIYHRRTSEVGSNNHRRTSEVGEDILEDQQAEKVYTGSTSDNHHERGCGREYLTEQSMKEHFRTSDFHKGSYCRTCDLDFGTESCLNEVLHQTTDSSSIRTLT